MKYIDEFRQGDLARRWAETLAKAADTGRHYRLMEFCGGHTHTLFRHGIHALLPANVKMLHGPGCPVCVLPIARLDAAIHLASQPDVILCSYGDMLRVPGSRQMSLLKARAQGADVRMIYSTAEVLRIAADHPDKRVIFFAIGFETTTPPTAVLLDAIERQGVRNVQVFCNHVLTPPAIRGILEPARQRGERVLDGLVGPGHVSVITGSEAYTELAKTYQTPITIAGFEPLDLLQSITLLVKQINREECGVHNQYTRAVTSAGNIRAQALIDRYFELRESFEWRGLGELPASALQIRPQYRHLDAEADGIAVPVSGHDNKACECPSVLTGRKKPTECPLFDRPCTPENPLGACMVSSEGACAAYYQFQKHRYQKHRPERHRPETHRDNSDQAQVQNDSEIHVFNQEG